MLDVLRAHELTNGTVSIGCCTEAGFQKLEYEAALILTPWCFVGVDTNILLQISCFESAVDPPSLLGPAGHAATNPTKFSCTPCLPSPSIRQGCVIIFLSNFLALLIIFLILAVLSTSWFATQQMVDDSREDESSLTLAKTMLTFEERSPDASPPPGLRRPHRVHPGDDASVSTAITPRATAAGTPLGAAASATPRSAAVRTLRSVAASTPRRSTASTPRRSTASTPRGGGVSAATVEALRREGQAAGTPSRPSR